MPTQLAPHLTAQSFVFLLTGPLADAVTPWHVFRPAPPMPWQVPPRLTTQAFAFLLTGPLGRLTPVPAFRPLPFPEQPAYFVAPPAPPYFPVGPLGLLTPIAALRTPPMPWQFEPDILPPQPPAPYAPVGPLGYGFVPWWGPGRPLPASLALQTDDLYPFPQLGPLALAVTPDEVFLAPPPAPTQRRTWVPAGPDTILRRPLALDAAPWAAFLRPPFPGQPSEWIIPVPPPSPYFPLGPLALFQQPRGIPAWPPIVVVQLRVAVLPAGVPLPPPLTFPTLPPLRRSPDARSRRWP